MTGQSDATLNMMSFATSSLGLARLANRVAVTTSSGSSALISSTYKTRAAKRNPTKCDKSAINSENKVFHETFRKRLRSSYMV